MVGRISSGEILILLLIAVAWVLACAWIYRDANRRGMRGEFWVLALIFTSVFGGLFIYLAIRDRFPARN